MSQTVQPPQFEIPGKSSELEPVGSDILPKPLTGERSIPNPENHIPASQNPILPTGQSTTMSITQAPVVADDTTAGVAMTADDVDVIEKEWVVKAKKVLEQYSDDPRSEAMEFSKLKADYMMKRFKKELKQQADGDTAK
jgi:hypothetical protein